MQAPGASSGFRVPRGPTVNPAGVIPEPEPPQLPLERGEDAPFYAYLFTPARGAVAGPDGAFGEIIVARMPTDGAHEGEDAEEEEEAGAPVAHEHVCGIWWPIRAPVPAGGDAASARADWLAARRVAMQRSRQVARAIAKHEQECERRKAEVAAARIVQAESSGALPTTIDDYVALRVGRASAIGRILRERNGRQNGIRNLEKLQALLDQVVETFGLAA